MVSINWKFLFRVEVFVRWDGGREGNRRRVLSEGELCLSVTQSGFYHISASQYISWRLSIEFFHFHCGVHQQRTSQITRLKKWKITTTRIWRKPSWRRRGRNKRKKNEHYFCYCHAAGLTEVAEAGGLLPVGDPYVTEAVFTVWLRLDALNNYE